MPARGKHHDVVRQALIADGWTITHDPLRLPIGKKDLYADLGAEMVGAARGVEKIAVEIKAFGGPSEMEDLEQAIGQFVLYERILSRIEPERALYLALPESAADDIFQELVGQILLDR